MKKEPKITIIIVNWNGIDDTIQCLESLKKINYSNYSIIIIDNNSYKNEIIQLEKKFNNLKIIKLKKNLGFAIANNVGIRIALNLGTEYILLLNNDTIVDKKFLIELIKEAEKDSTIGILSSKIYFLHDKKMIWYAGGKLNMFLRHKTLGLFKHDDGKYDKIQKTDYVTGACMLIKKNVFGKSKLLAREYFLGWEDIDFCIYAKKLGFNCLYVPKSKIWHKASASFKKNNLKYMQIFYGFRNRVIMRYKYLSKPKFFLFLILQISLVLPVHFVFYLFHYRDFKRIKYAINGFNTGIRDMKERKVLYKPLTNN